MDQLNQYLRPPTAALRALIVSAGIVGLLATALGYYALQTRAVAIATEGRLERRSALQLVKPVEKKSVAVLETQKKWASLRAERDFSWPEVFAAVEKAGNPEIELLAFRPDKGSRMVLLGGEARDQKALLMFINALAEQANLNNVHLTLQQRKKRDRIETVVFEIRAQISR